MKTDAESPMTTEERFEPIEWRDTQRHIDEVAMNLSKLTVQVVEVDDRLSARIADVNDRLGARIEALAEESRAADKRLEQRIESMVSGIGEFIRVQREKI
jgi:hypothetical protein